MQIRSADGPLDSTDVQAKLRISIGVSTVGVRMSESSSRWIRRRRSRAIPRTLGEHRSSRCFLERTARAARPLLRSWIPWHHRRQMRFCVCSLSVPSSVSRVSIKKQRTGVALRVMAPVTAQTLRSVKPQARGPQRGLHMTTRGLQVASMKQVSRHRQHARAATLSQ